MVRKEENRKRPLTKDDLACQSWVDPRDDSITPLCNEGHCWKSLSTDCRARTMPGLLWRLDSSRTPLKQVGGLASLFYS